MNFDNADLVVGLKFSKVPWNRSLEYQSTVGAGAYYPSHSLESN